MSIGTDGHVGDTVHDVGVEPAVKVPAIDVDPTVDGRAIIAPAIGDDARPMVQGREVPGGIGGQQEDIGAGGWSDQADLSGRNVPPVDRRRRCQGCLLVAEAPTSQNALLFPSPENEGRSMSFEKQWFRRLAHVARSASCACMLTKARLQRLTPFMSIVSIGSGLLLYRLMPDVRPRAAVMVVFAVGLSGFLAMTIFAARELKAHYSGRRPQSAGPLPLWSLSAVCLSAAGLLVGRIVSITSL